MDILIIVGKEMGIGIVVVVVELGIRGSIAVEFIIRIVKDGVGISIVDLLYMDSGLAKAWLLCFLSYWYCITVCINEGLCIKVQQAKICWKEEVQKQKMNGNELQYTCLSDSYTNLLFYFDYCTYIY